MNEQCWISCCRDIQWKQLRWSEPTMLKEYASCPASIEGQPSVSADWCLCTVHVWGCPWHGGLCQETESALSPSPHGETAWWKIKERKEREEEGENVPTWVWHSAVGLICSPWQLSGGGLDGRGNPLAFWPGTKRKGTAVLTSVTSLLSAGQILEYQWTDSVPLAVVLKSVWLL